MRKRVARKVCHLEAERVRKVMLNAIYFRRLGYIPALVLLDHPRHRQITLKRATRKIFPEL